MSIQEQIVATAKVWAEAKVPYMHRGTTRRGCDCSGLLVGIARELGYLKDFELPLYPPDWHLHGFRYKHNYITEYIAKYASRVPIHCRQPGDILLFKYAGIICHTGIYIGEDLFIHSYILRPVCYGTLRNSPWGSRLVEVWRLDEVKLGAAQ